MKRIALTLVIAATAVFDGCCGNARFVNMFMGTSGDHGQVTPAASVPFGYVSVCPDSSPWQHAGYDYAVPHTTGVSVTRISGTGCSGVGGDLRIKPCAASDSLFIVKGTEKAVPGYYETMFSNGVKGRFTATRDMAVEEYRFAGDALLYIDFMSSIDPTGKECAYEIMDSNRIVGFVKSPTVCARGRYKLYFNLTTSEPFAVAAKDSTSAVLNFNASKVEVRISLSAIDQANAEKITEKYSGKSFATLRKEASGLWAEKLDRISVKGSTKEQKILFYTSLMRIYHSPMNVTSDEGFYFGTDGKVHKAEGFTYYSSWSLWDTFRAKIPMLTVLEPEAMGDMCESLVHLYHNGKRNWATPYEACPTVRTEHANVLLLDAYRKGIKGFDMSYGYEGMKLEEERDYPMSKPDQKLESCYDMWALGEIAAILGNEDDAAYYTEKADTLFESVWKKEFMEITPSFTVMRRNGLYQGSRYQYRWMCPQYYDRLVEWVGKEQLVSELNDFFDKKQFNQGNEPDIQTPFIFNRLGAYDRTSEIVRSYLTDDNMVHVYGGNAEYPEPYVGRAFRNELEGYAPEMDEDVGTMSAWYMFAQMGFYPLTVGRDEYELFSPIFDRIVIKPAGIQKKVVIRTEGRRSYEDRISSIELDGEPLGDCQISNKLFLEGGTLVFKY
ncbi:MAG: glycoside hydrolase family 92 protein [Bacteroidales bacterium]|nr:glycoside hydrolase family 92 protein [Bacteroidales bacterium]